MAQDPNARSASDAQRPRQDRTEFIRDRDARAKIVVHGASLEAAAGVGRILNELGGHLEFAHLRAVADAGSNRDQLHQPWAPSDHESGEDLSASIHRAA